MSGETKHSVLLYSGSVFVTIYGKDLLRINLYILLVWFSDLIVRKPRRTPVRLRFLLHLPYGQVVNSSKTAAENDIPDYPFIRS